MRVLERGDRGVVQSIVLFLGVSVLSGTLAAGLLIPFAGLAQFGTEKTSDTLEKLPTELKTGPLPTRSRIVTADGKQVAWLYDQNRVPTNLSGIAPIMQRAIIAIEDSRFFEHGALDAKGTLRALLRNKAAGGVTQGGSSITQQYVKMTLIQQAKTEAEQQAATAETMERKIKELRYAVAMEKEFTKPQILERYLNIAYFGDGAYGIEAAARHYFSTHANKLTLPQAALLAGLVKNPTSYNPTSHPLNGKQRRDVVIRRMLELKIITPAQATAAVRTPVLNGTVSEVPNGCANSQYPFYCEYVVAKLLENPALGKTRAEREQLIKTGGITVTTSLDSEVQRKVQEAVYQHSYESDRPAVAMTVIEPGTGLVKAMAQNKRFGSGKGQTYYNFNTERYGPGAKTSYKGSYNGFQPGSSAKAFTLAAAIQKGVPLNYTINSPKEIDLKGPFTTCGKPWNERAPYHVKNSTERSGNLTLIQAAQASTNTYFAQLEKRIGICAAVTMAQQLGVYNVATGKGMSQVPSFTLGVDAVTPMMMANAYATFAARGIHCDPVVVTSIVDKVHRPISTPGANCGRVMQEAHADGVNYVLHKVMEKGGTGAGLNFGRPAAGKTGTTNDNADVWYVGYTPTYAGATVVGALFPDKSLNGLRMKGDRIGKAHGSTTAGPIWEDAMRAIHEGLPEENFHEPDKDIVKGVLTKLPQTGGMSLEEAMNVLKAAGFAPTVADHTVPSDYPANTVAYTDPRWYDGAPSGAAVTIYLSSGQPKTPPTTKPPGKPTPTIPVPTINPTCPPWRPKCNH
jgi:membrane peptidoglycan carboxypeptidase